MTIYKWNVQRYEEYHHVTKNTYSSFQCWANVCSIWALRAPISDVMVGQVRHLIIDGVSWRISPFGDGWLPLVASGVATFLDAGDVILDMGDVDVVRAESPLGELRSWPSLILMANSARPLASGIRPSEERENGHIVGLTFNIPFPFRDYQIFFLEQIEY